MTAQPASIIKDKHYDLVSVLHTSQKLVWELETYVEDAQKQGDAELAEWFAGLQAHCRSFGDECKHLLAQRLTKD
ncbi:hypothetical protein Pth03_25720 [Planotetraspora thailandica]|uniref:Uncharacterized protein n=1 Tax=Planotetraspora thailandica TaxID=487172 RepID=A0A8J3XYD3_9ACTN|nr:hypothetical protein [Planotetraspora thailandica]GII54183.1 hypothetical protein Pth03_25720 [Planotetraspora thailandica]